jgi:hypothetical protein
MRVLADRQGRRISPTHCANAWRATADVLFMGTLEPRKNVEDRSIRLARKGVGFAYWR